MPDRDFRPCSYRDDEGKDWLTKVDAFMLAQVDGQNNCITGAGEITGTMPDLPPMPRGLRPRGVYVRTAGRSPRFVVCHLASAPLYTGAVNTVQLQTLGGAATTYSRHKAKREVDTRVTPGLQ